MFAILMSPNSGRSQIQRRAIAEVERERQRRKDARHRSSQRYVINITLRASGRNGECPHGLQRGRVIRVTS